MCWSSAFKKRNEKKEEILQRKLNPIWTVLHSWMCCFLRLSLTPWSLMLARKVLSFPSNFFFHRYEEKIRGTEVEIILSNNKNVEHGTEWNKFTNLQLQNWIVLLAQPQPIWHVWESMQGSLSPLEFSAASSIAVWFAYLQHTNMASRLSSTYQRRKVWISSSIQGKRSRLFTFSSYAPTTLNLLLPFRLAVIRYQNCPT